jgi:cyclopropane-fatty-acyl-phospholipid synthase
MFFSFLNNTLVKGKIEIIDASGNSHSFGTSSPYIKIKLKSKSIERKIFINPNLYFGEGYMNEDLVIEDGNIEDLIDVITSSYEGISSSNWMHKFLNNIQTFFRPFQQLNNLVTSKKNVAHHYDLNEELYRLFLDKDMQYSCAYFYNDNISLDQAQIDKKNHLIKKLQIDKNMTVLDIGCGWGGLALHIARETGAKVKGLTLSKNQLATAKRRAQEDGLADRVEFVLQDYRHEQKTYDRIVSVGMFEHVGVNYFKDFFSKTYSLLKKNGIFLLHTIGQKDEPSATNPWIRKYIFPGGYIPSLTEILKVCEKQHIIISDIEILRLHYANTLKQWYRNFLLNKERIIKMFDERFFRMWEFYLLTSQYSFRNMGNVVFQIQMTKEFTNLPPTRDYIYN